MAANTVLVIIAAIGRKPTGLFYLLPMVIGVPYFLSTMGIKSYFQRNETNTAFTLLNYNIANFRIKENFNANNPAAAADLYELVLNPETDVQCYQEFINYPWSKEGNVIKRLTELNRHFYFSMEPETDHMDYSRLGTLIISKFPIISSGDVLAGESGFNRASYIDVVV